MQCRDVRLGILAQDAEKPGKGNPQRQHYDHHKAHRRFVNQLGPAHNQRNPTLW
jgi:hypothetical protein